MVLLEETRKLQREQTEKGWKPSEISHIWEIWDLIVPLLTPPGVEKWSSHLHSRHRLTTQLPPSPLHTFMAL